MYGLECNIKNLLILKIMETFFFQLSWYHLIFLRFMLCIAPQYGYIFPDEFCQSTEVMAGEVFGYSHLRTWEWNPSKPARTVLFPFISSGLPFMFLKYIASVFGYKITTHSLLIIPRLWMTVLSLVNDIVIYKLAYKLFLNKNIANIASLLYASSYTTLVYCTRTFSNSAETTLFGLLLYLVIIKTDNSHDLKEVSGESLQKQVVDPKVSFYLSVVIVFGLFTRITFIAFMFVPVTYWLCQGLAQEKLSYAFQVLFKRSISLLPGACFTLIVFVFCDCCFFDYDLLTKFPLAVFMMDKNLTVLYNWAKDLPLTPLNALQYNLNASNLAKHGVHPWYLHVAVNLPLMFTPVVFALLPLLFNLKSYLQSYGSKYSRIVALLLLCTVLFSLTILSSVPHQEPRFLLPLIVPLIVLLSRCLHPLSSHKFLLVLWICCNFLCFVFFALLHQGGIIPSLVFMSSLTKSYNREASGSWGRNAVAVYYRTYMPPVHLASIPQHASANENRVEIKDLAGSSYKTLEGTLNSALLAPHSALYLVLPATLECDQFERLRSSYLLEQKYSVFPHLSMEDPPWSDQVCGYSTDSGRNYIVSVLSNMILSIYEVKSLTPSKPGVHPPTSTVYLSNLQASAM